MSEQVFYKAFSMLAIAGFLGATAVQAGEPPAPKRTGAPVHQCYHSGSAFCRAQLMQKDRARFVQLLARANGMAADKTQCDPEQVANAKPKQATTAT